MLAFSARVDVAGPQERLTVPSSTAQAMPLVRFGRVFLPFRDATSGGQSYGGGRYLLDTAKSADLGSTASGEMVLDFNFAFHPSCSYDPRWSCPLAPPQNVLSGPVRAGERAF